MYVLLIDCSLSHSQLCFVVLCAGIDCIESQSAMCVFVCMQV